MEEITTFEIGESIDKLKEDILGVCLEKRTLQDQLLFLLQEYSVNHNDELKYKNRLKTLKQIFSYLGDFEE